MRYLLAYDTDCGPCTRFKEMLEFLDPRHRLGFVSLVDADGSGLLAGIPPRRRYASMHVISSSSLVWSGADALPVLVALFPLGTIPSKVISAMPRVRGLSRFLYSTLARLHGKGSCSLTPGLRRVDITDGYSVGLV